MASLISASGATGTGSLTIQGPSTNSNQVLTIPDATGTAMVSGNMPAFSAYQSSAQSLSTSTETKLQFQTKEFDTANAFDNTTNYRFQPLVAGYYQVNGGFVTATTATNLHLAVYKNGSIYRYLGLDVATTQSSQYGSCLVYLNGSTDYIELYGSQGTTTQNTSASTPQRTYFQACMVRSA